MGFDYDAELRRYQERLRAAADVRPGDHVLDVGCGTGLATREAARAAGPAGSALGVDHSAAMVERARALTAADGPGNARFLLADAAAHPFPPARFDLGLSRFGTMFFADPVAAFGHLGRALRPGARLVQLVWQARGHQEWAAVVRRALGADPPRAGADPFSLADPATVTGVLTRAGFADVRLTDLREPVWYGPDTAAATEAVLGLRRPDPADVDRARAALLAAIAPYETADGVWFGARAWLVEAHRP